MLDRLYENTVHIVTEVMEKWVSESGQKTPQQLDRLLTEAEAKAARASRPRSTRAQAEVVEDSMDVELPDM